MEKIYSSNVRTIAAKTRNQRMRETQSGSGGSSTVIIDGGGETPAPIDPNSHTHDNKAYLDQISTDISDYLYLRQGHMVNGEVVKQTNKVKAGYADTAGELSPTSPTRKDFVSRINDDTVKGRLTFEQMLKMMKEVQLKGGAVTTSMTSGMDTDVYRHGLISGRGFAMTKNEARETVAEADVVIARKRFEANVLDIRNETFSAGNVNLTNANGRAVKVEGYDMSNKLIPGMYDAEGKVVKADGQENVYFVKYFRIYFRAEDGERHAQNLWHRGDMAYCKTLNLQTGQREWHRVVTDRGKRVLEDGKEYCYITVSNEKKISVTAEDGSVTEGVMGFNAALANSYPQTGDIIVQKGSVTELMRSGITSIDSSGDGYGGLYVVEGIGAVKGSTEQFMPTDTPIIITPKEVSITSDNFYFATRDANGHIIARKNVKAELQIHSDEISSMVQLTTEHTQSISEIKQTADNISLKVQSTGAKNLLEGSKKLVAKNLKVFALGSGIGTWRDFVNVGTAVTSENTQTQYINLLAYDDVMLKPNTRYTLSWMMCGTRNSVMDFYVTNTSGVRIIKQSWSCDDDKPRGDIDAHHQINANTGGKWQKGWMTIDTADFEEGTPALIVLGRLFVKAVENSGWICAPKLEEGAEATEWTAHENDIEEDLRATGIDIKNGYVTITADTFSVLNNAGKETALLDASGMLTTSLINADEVTANALNGKKLTVVNAVIVGLRLLESGQFGSFVLGEGGTAIESTDYTTADKCLRMDNEGIGMKRYKARASMPQNPPIQQIHIGPQPIGSNKGEALISGEMSSSTDNLQKMRLIYMKTAETTQAQRDRGAFNDVFYSDGGTVSGVTLRTRSVSADAANNQTVQLTKDDHKIFIKGTLAITILLPRGENIEHGKTVTIWNCTTSANIIKCADNSTMTDAKPIARYKAKIYTYDKEAHMWLVNSLT